MKKQNYLLSLQAEIQKNTMLSILIPTYNFNSFPLVKSLQKQAEEALIPYEIIVIDDASMEFTEINEDINSIPNCSYIMLKRNVGRAKIRNTLAKKAKYNYLLFIDGDAEVASVNFINRYLPFCKENVVVCGGCQYHLEDSREKDYQLRLAYGKKREALSAKSRSINPYKSFSSFNFLIPKEIFLEILFDESIVKYGHEDTLFGFELKQRRSPICHIQNPLIHLGIETSSVFMQKTKESIQNLLLISKKPEYKHIVDEISLLKAYTILKKLNLHLLFKRMYKHIHPSVSRNLGGYHPSMFCFDLFKLAYLCKIDK